jgi:hypothetical protein
MESDQNPNRPQSTEQCRIVLQYRNAAAQYRLLRLPMPKDNAAMNEPPKTAAPKRRCFQFRLRTLFVVMTVIAFLTSAAIGAGIGSAGFWSPFGGQLQFVVVLVAAIVLIGGGAVLTWIVAPTKLDDSNDNERDKKLSSDNFERE